MPTEKYCERELA